MRKLSYSIFAFCMFLFASSSYAEEIVMICAHWFSDSGQQTRYYKYSNPLFGEKKILQRVDGTWRKWDIAAPGYRRELSISDKGAVLTDTLKTKLLKKLGAYQKGTLIRSERKYFLDFEFLTRRYEETLLSMDGDKLYEDVEKWSCRLKDEESQSIKGRMEGVIK